MINRRSLIGSIISLACAPAIVRASSLMPVKVVDQKLLDVITKIEPFESPFLSLYRNGGAPVHLWVNEFGVIEMLNPKPMTYPPMTQK